MERKPENLNLWQYQLSKHFSKLVFESTGMTKIFGLKGGEKSQRTGFFRQKLPLNYYPQLQIQNRSFKIFLIIDITKNLGFRSNKNPKCLPFFLFHFWIFLFQIQILFLEILPIVPKLLNFDKYLKVTVVWKKCAMIKKIVP